MVGDWEFHTHPSVKYVPDPSIISVLGRIRMYGVLVLCTKYCDTSDKSIPRDARHPGRPARRVGSPGWIMVHAPMPMGHGSWLRYPDEHTEYLAGCLGRYSVIDSSVSGDELQNITARNGAHHAPAAYHDRLAYKGSTFPPSPSPRLLVSFP